jgi:glutathione S-transferase
MILYHSLTSPYSRKARVMLLEKGVPFEGIDVRSTGQSSSGHNPLGKIPTLVLDDGTAIFDSTVITETVEALFPSPALIPSEPIERALVRRWESLADGVCDVVIPVVVDSLREPSLQNATYNEKLLGKAKTTLTYLEKALTGRTYVHGEAFSLADIAVITMLDYVNLRRPELLKGNYPEIHRYRDAFQSRVSIVTTVPPKLPISG